jgi:protein-disulfide isomerase
MNRRNIVWVSALSLILGSVIPGHLNASEVEIELSDLAGQMHAPARTDDKPAAVVFFVSPYCPTSNTLMTEINKIIATYGERVKFSMVHAESAVKAEDVQQHLEMFQVKVPVLLDREQKLAKQFQAGITPEVVVVGKGGKVLYQGRINDLYLAATKRQRQAKVHDLRMALDEVLAGKPVTVPKTEAVGCLLK